MARTTGRARASTDRSPSPAVLAALLERKAWDVLVVPLRSGDRDRGYLEVRDRLSRWGRFRDEDLQLLETLSGHVATALDNLRLLETLRHEAYHDAITGLRNRLGLNVEGQAAISQGWGGAIVLVELDVLSQVNNALGHDRGERLLQMAGERLVALVGESRPVARIEADRFAVLVNAMPETELIALGTEILATVGRAYSLDGIEVDPQAERRDRVRRGAGRDGRGCRRGGRRHRPEHPAAARRDGDAGRQGQAGAAADLPAEHG